MPSKEIRRTKIERNLQSDTITSPGYCGNYIQRSQTETEIINILLIYKLETITQNNQP